MLCTKSKYFNRTEYNGASPIAIAAGSGQKLFMVFTTPTQCYSREDTTPKLHSSRSQSSLMALGR